MTVPSSHPELRALLAALIRGEDVAFALHDWLMERGDERADNVRAWMAAPKTNKHMVSILHLFSVQLCHTCHVLDANDLHTGCAECSGLGWSMLIDKEKIDCKVERWIEIFPPVRAPLIQTQPG